MTDEASQFTQARESYLAAMARFKDAREAEFFARDEARYARESMAAIENQLLVGDTDLPPVLGKNADERAASRELILNGSGQWAAYQARLRSNERNAAQEALEAQQAQAQMALELRTLEWLIANARAEVG